MTFVKNLYADIVDKRLWPLALVLLVALIAVPVLLSKDAKEQPVQPLPPSGALGGDASTLLGETQPAVTLEGAEAFRKHVAHLSRKNPFVQQARIKTKKGTTGDTATPLSAGAVPTTGTTTAPPSVTAPGATQPAQFNYTATVEFGEIGETDKKTLSPTDALPNTADPVVVFMGASSGGDKAVFVVSSSATARGDGDCKPSTSKCNFLYMKAGDVEFIEVAGENDTVKTYQLELTKIGAKEVNNKVPTSSARHELGLKRTLPSAGSKNAERAGEALRAKQMLKALRLLGL